MILDRLDAIEDNLSTLGSTHTGQASMLRRFTESKADSSPARSTSSIPMMMPTDNRPFSEVSGDFEGMGLRGEFLY